MNYFKLIAAVVALALIIFAVLWGITTFQKITGTSSTSINVSRPAVIKQLQALNRYETASYTIEKIIDAGTSGNKFQEFFYGDRLLLIAHGQVVAGFDLSALKEDDIKLEGQTLTLNLPKPQILYTKLESDKTRVYDRNQGILNQGDKDLESKARQAAEESIKEAACTEHILDKASENARNQLSILLKSLGFQTVILNIPEASC